MTVGLRPLILLLILGYPCFRAVDVKGIQGMLNLERELLKNLRKYAVELEEKINLIDDSIDEYIDEIEEASKDPELYLSNPLNAFRLIRHMHQDWASWQVYMEKPVAPEAVENLELLLPQLPEKRAYKQAAKEVHDLAQFYDYKPSDLVAENERNSSLHLSPLDCYVLGLERFEEKDYLGAAKWLTVAAENYTLSEYSDLYGLLGAPRWKMYRDQARVLLKLNRPSVYEAYEKAFNLSVFNVHLMDEIGEWELNSLRDPMEPIADPLPMPTILESQCRGNVVPQSKLECANNYYSYFLEIAPLHYEVLFDPLTVLYPNSVYPAELSHVEEVYDLCPPSGRFQLAKGITGCSISDGYSPIMRRINERVLDMTALNRAWKSFFVVEYDSLKLLEVFNLFKNATKLPQLKGLEMKDVETTAIIFLKDVTEGGAVTVTNHGVFVQPKRGNVLVTFEEAQLETTMCPIVVGKGLVMIKFGLEDK